MNTTKTGAGLSSGKFPTRICKVIFHRGARSPISPMLSGMHIAEIHRPKNHDDYLLKPRKNHAVKT